MVCLTTRIVVVLAAAAVALSGCTSTAAHGGTTNAQSGSPTGAQIGTPTSTQKPITNKLMPAPPTSQGLASKEALGDVILGAITVDAKLGSPSAEITITNHSSKRSNYIVDLSLMSADGKIQLDAAMVSAQGLAPGMTAKRPALFKTTQKLPAGAKLKIVGVARLDRM